MQGSSTPARGASGTRKNYCYLLGAFTISGLGDWLSKIAIPVFIWEGSGSALAMAVAYAIICLPFIIATPIGGILADRMSRRAILLCGDLVAALLTGALAIIVSSPNPPTMWLYTLLFLLGLTSGVYCVAFDTIVPDIVEPDQLMKANAVTQSVGNAVGLLGPIAAGVITATMGTTGAVYLDAASFGISFLLLSRLRGRSEQRVACERLRLSSIGREIASGVHHAWSNCIIRYGTLVLIIYNVAFNLFYANIMFFLLQIHRLSAAEVGLVLAVAGLAGIIGAMLAPALSSLIPAGAAILLAAQATGLCILLLLVANDAVSISLLWGLATGFNAVIVVTYFTLRQQVTEGAYLGRTVAVTRVANFSAIPLASVLGGWLLSSTGRIDYVIALSGITAIAGASLGWGTPFMRTPQLTAADSR
jgi:predicted MFS family arabinose efflux permease